MTIETAEPVKPPRHRRTVWTAIVASQLCLALTTAFGVTWVHRNLNDNIEPGQTIEHIAGVEKDSTATDEGPTGPLNILVMGSDSRDGAGNNLDGLTGGGERSDTTILLHVSANRKTAYGVSLPRDAIVDRPECTDTDGETVPAATAVMFNSAFSVGGALCTVATVESLTGIYIDHFVVLDFNGFKDMVDAVGGVEVCIPEEVDDAEHNIFLDAGVQTLTGQDALNYVRERYQLSVTGDIGRMKRQQAFIASMVAKVMSAGTLSQPTRVVKFLNAVTSSIQVDDGIDSVGQLAGLAMQFQDTGLDKIKFITVPIAEYPEDPNRLIWTDDADELWQRIKDDKGLGRAFSATSIEAADSVGTLNGTDTATAEPTTDPTTETPSDTATSDPTSEPTDEVTDGSGSGLSEEEQAARRAAGLCV